MNINEVINTNRVCEIKLSRKAKDSRKLMAVWDRDMGSARLKVNTGRVYLVVINGEIEKIGGSQSKGGIKNTIGSYLGGYAPGNSPRTYCCWNKFYQAIKNGDKVEIYATWAPTVECVIPTMTGSVTRTIPVDFHTIEDAFVQEYVLKHGKHPELNIQEAGRTWQETGLLEGWPGMAGKAVI